MVHRWAPQRHKPPLCAGMQTTQTGAKAPFIIPQILAYDMPVVLLQLIFCSSGRRGKGRGGKKKPCALQTQFCTQYQRAPVRGEGGGQKGEGKGCGESQNRGKKTLTHYLWQENHPRAEHHLGYQCRLLFSFGSFLHTRCLY